MQEESFKTPATSENSFVTKLPSIYNGGKQKKIKRNYLIQDNTYFILRNVVNVFVYELDAWSRDLNTDFTLSNFLFGAVKLKAHSWAESIFGN